MSLSLLNRGEKSRDERGLLPMSMLEPAVKAELIDQWLPRLRDLKRERKPLLWIMLALLIVPVVLAISIVAYQLLNNNLGLDKVGLCSLLLGLSSISFVYVGKLQACNDSLTFIEYYVIRGDKKLIDNSISNISCFGSMRGIFQDIRVIMKGSHQ
jgi:hypothetical protein